MGSARFQKTGLIQTVYFSILVTHTILAVAVLPVILRTLFLAAKEQIEEHRRWARWAFPIWLYVSVTGVSVYWMLYRLWFREENEVLKKPTVRNFKSLDGVTFKFDTINLFVGAGAWRISPPPCASCE